MRFWGFLLTSVLVLAGCKPQNEPVEIRPVRTIVVNPKPIQDDRQSVGEIKPRYESDLSFRVAGKLLSRLVDVGSVVKQGDTLAALDTQDFKNHLRQSEADVLAAQASLIDAQATEWRLGALVKTGATSKASYDTALATLRSAEARLTSTQANLDLTRDQLNYTELKADFDGVITAVGAEAGQNVTAGQMVVKLAQPGAKDGVFNIAETALIDHPNEEGEVVVWPLSNPALTISGKVREISPVADAATRTYTVKVTLDNPPPQIRFGMSIGGRQRGSRARMIVLPVSALFEKNGSPAVWVFDQEAGSVALKPVTVARYESDTVIIESGLAKGEVVVTAGINTLREGQKVRLAEVSRNGSNDR